MNDATRPPRTAELVALALATDANGNVDLTAYEAQRLILLHQSVDGLDAKGLVGELANSPAYASAEGRAQIGPLLEAISRRLPATEATRFSDALDQANVNESWLERNYERYLEEPIAAGYRQARQAVGDGLSWTDKQISDSLAATRRWADGVRDDPQNSYLERATGQLVASGAGDAQNAYGAMKGATGHGLALLGETVDLAQFAHRFSTDQDFRNLIIGTAAIYASDAIRDPSKPFTDIQNAAVKAWNEWEAGLEQATQAGKEQEYLGEARGAAAVEIIATFVPASKLTKLGKVARAVDVAEDLVPDGAGRAAVRVEGKMAGELAEELVDLGHDARRVQAREGLEGAGADLAFSGLAGIKRSQGELRELVDGLRKSGDLDGLLQSGALAPKELNYLARHDITMFDGEVSFHQALSQSLRGRELSALKSGEIGDIGEAIVAHDLVRKGYRDLVPIQNNSGHGNDLAGIHPETERWEVVEVKASVKGIAKAQSGDPVETITDRLNLAVRGEGHWAPKNMWEEQAQGTAQRILRETEGPTGELDIDAKWARVNLERDAVSGELKGKPEIEAWRSSAQRARERSEAPAGIDRETPARGEASLPPNFAPSLKPSADGMAPAVPSSRDQLRERFLRALAADDREGMRAASIAFVDSEDGQRLITESQERLLRRQQQLPGRDQPLFVQAMRHLDRLGPEAAGYTDQADMERVAGAVALEAKRMRMPAIDDLVAADNGQLTLIRKSERHAISDQYARIDGVLASLQPLERSFQQLAQETQLQSAQDLQREQERQMSAQRGRSI